jgi:hypothetical protein
MNRLYCEKEMEIIEALRGGTLNAELARHASICAICADTLAVSEFLQTDRRAAQVVPDPDCLWWKAHLASRQKAVERATRSIGLVRKVSYLGVAVTGLWLVFAQGHLESLMTALSKHQSWLTGGLGETAVFMGVGALIFTLLSSLYLARPEK